MMESYVCAGMHPDPFICALFGTAAILEIVHPDAAVSEEIGSYGKITSAYVAGKAAAGTAGLPVGHICGYSVAFMKALMFFEGDEEKAMKAVLADRWETSFNPEYAFISINLTARKAETIHRGKVTRLMIQWTDPVWHYQMHKSGIPCDSRAGTQLL